MSAILGPDRFIALPGGGMPRVLLAAAVATVAAGCATPPEPPSVTAAAPAPRSEPRRSFFPGPDEALRERARAADQERRWADAIVQWEAVLLLRPDDAEATAQIASLRARIADGVGEAMSRGEQARRRGDADAATTAYLRALALDPHHAGAQAALREIERDRLRRGVLGRAPRPMGGQTPGGTMAGPGDNAEVELGVQQFRQGDYAAAAQTLQRHLQRSPKDVLARAYLADSLFLLAMAASRNNRNEEAIGLLERAISNGPSDPAQANSALAQLRRSVAADYFRRGNEAQGARDVRRAISLWEQALKFDPTHAGAQAKLRESRGSVAPTGAQGPLPSARDRR